MLAWVRSKKEDLTCYMSNIRSDGLGSSIEGGDGRILYVVKPPFYACILHLPVGEGNQPFAASQAPSRSIPGSCKTPACLRIYSCRGHRLVAREGGPRRWLLHSLSQIYRYNICILLCAGKILLSRGCEEALALQLQWSLAVWEPKGGQKGSREGREEICKFQKSAAHIYARGWIIQPITLIWINLPHHYKEHWEL